jgi:membrane-associated phospholipid phosphatase
MRRSDRDAITGMETPWSARRPPSRALIAIAGVAAIVTVGCVLVVDEPALRAITSYEPSGAWDGGVEILEWIILLPLHKLALPVVLVAAMLATVFVKRWRGAAPALMTITAVHLITRLTTNWIKDGTGRYRPYQAFEKGIDDSFGNDGVAFPSGHVVLFASLVIPLLYAVPRVRVLAVPLLAIVVFVAGARIAVGAHWISDTTGAITWVVLWTYLVGWAARPSR